MVQAINRSLSVFERAELEPEEISLAESTLFLAVTDSEYRPRKEIDKLLTDLRFQQALVQFLQEPLSKQYKVLSVNEMLDEIRDELLVFPIELAKEDPEAIDDSESEVPETRARWREKMQTVNGLRRADAAHILAVVRDYQDVNPATIRWVVADEVPSTETVFEASLRFLKSLSQDSTHDFVHTEITGILERYISLTDYSAFPPEVRIFFEQKIAQIFEVPYTRGGLSSDWVHFATVEIALELLNTIEPVSTQDPLRNDEPRFRPPLPIDDALIDRYMELLNQRLSLPIQAETHPT